MLRDMMVRVVFRGRVCDLAAHFLLVFVIIDPLQKILLNASTRFSILRA